MKVLFIHDCAGVALALRRLLIKRGHKADLLFFGVGPNKGDPYIKKNIGFAVRGNQG